MYERTHCGTSLAASRQPQRAVRTSECRFNRKAIGSAMSFPAHLVGLRSLRPATRTRFVSTPKLIADTLSCGAMCSTHVASEWEIFKGSKLLHDTGTDTADLLALSVATGNLPPVTPTPGRSATKTTTATGARSPRRLHSR